LTVSSKSEVVFEHNGVTLGNAGRHYVVRKEGKEIWRSFSYDEAYTVYRKEAYSEGDS